MEKTYRVRIYSEEELVDKWKINEKQKQIIHALIGKNLFYEDVKFVIEEEEELYKDFT